ncbi:sigma-54-dependent Fis family transcriptional regulator [Stappia sp. F7233]|uniref:Sigma-54-dependent Fis family transcriptional regulator n=1 Tax=Stappia albiluteola TaxID=2758565 RepID=A0A839AAR7_9HYPH|nr:GAF domain-containing protein [Stappia albiluteola]MBA5775839.1 sigma-54-dependent Fis family transcriptional regulator [Stappia albiluteola]
MVLPAHMGVRRHADLVETMVRESASATRSIVAASWRRSMIYHGLNPASPRRTARVEARELGRARARNGELLEVAAPTLRRLFATAGDGGCCVVLTDADGLILQTNANAGDERTFSEWGLSAGAVWSEATEGTNGIGTCVAEKRPVVIYQNQHFSEQNIAMSCMGAPIFDHKGEMAAVLDVSSCRRDLSRSFAQVLGALVTESARAVESDLFRAAYRNERIIVADGHGMAGASLLAVDDDDLVVGATRQARRALDISEEKLRQTPPLRDYLRGAESSSGKTRAERSEIVRALRHSRGNVAAAARDLGISRATMYRRIQRHGIEV